MKAVISGASRGIGKAIAEELAREKFHLILISRGLTDLKEVASDLVKKHPESKIETINIDLADQSEREQLKEQFDAEGHIDLLVNNLGIYSMNQADQVNYRDLMNMLEHNLFSAIELTQILLPALRLSKQASIINIGSVMSIKAAHFASDYSISKHAMKAWNDALREQLRSENIKVSGIYSGAVNTSSWGDSKVDREAMIQPEDIASLVSTIHRMGPSALIEEIRISPVLF